MESISLCHPRTGTKDECCLCTKKDSDVSEIINQCDKCNLFFAHNECFSTYHYYISKCYFCHNEFKNQQPIMRIIIDPITLEQDEIIFSNVYHQLGFEYCDFGKTIYVPIVRNGELCMTNNNKRNEIKCQIKTINNFLDKKIQSGIEFLLKKIILDI